MPVRHFGVVLEWSVFPEIERRLREHGAEFVLEPYVRFEGKPGEQKTMFVRDPSGNALEFKTFRDPARLFAQG